jgi:hypothetical protein
MRFRIHGADRETGAEAALGIDAESIEKAQERANAAGFLVSKVQPIQANICDSAASISIPTGPPETQPVAPTIDDKAIRAPLARIVYFSGGAFLLLCIVVFVYHTGWPTKEATSSAGEDEIATLIRKVKTPRKDDPFGVRQMDLLDLSTKSKPGDPRFVQTYTDLMNDDDLRVRDYAAHLYWQETADWDARKVPGLMQRMENCSRIWGRVTTNETASATVRASAAKNLKHAMEDAISLWQTARWGHDTKYSEQTIREVLRIGLVTGVFPVRQLLADQGDDWKKKKWNTPEDVLEFQAAVMDLILTCMTKMKDEPELRPLAELLVESK